MATVDPRHDLHKPRNVLKDSFKLDCRTESIQKTWLKLSLFLMPCLLIVLSVYFIDAYKILGNTSIIAEPIRTRYGQTINPVLWKLPAFARNPRPNMVLGDSQMARLSSSDIEAVSGESYVNLAYPGGTLRESIATFWYAARAEKLKKIYFGVSFTAYNAFALNRVDEATEIIRHPVKCITNSDVLVTSLLDAMEQFFGKTTNLGPGLSRAVFWEKQLADLDSHYRTNTYPAQLKEGLKQIAEYCDSNGILLIFVIPPQHMDAQKRVRALGLESQYLRFKLDLASIATTYDYDIESEITRDANNYADPLHLSEAAAGRMARDLWSGQLHLAQQLPRTGVRD